MSKWTDKDIEILKKYYVETSAQYCIEHYGLNHTIKAIRKKARLLNIQKNKIWTDKELELLKYHWVNSDMDTLLKEIPNHSYNSMVCKATELGIHSQINRHRKGSLLFLDTLTPESAYWWGFIVADGHLSPRGELVITISNKDYMHLQKLQTHLKCNIVTRMKFGSYTPEGSYMSEIRIQDKKFQEKWYNILKFNGAKTYNPLDLSVFYQKDILVYFLIGLIDGDGSIWRHNKKQNSHISLRIEVHPNWYEKFRELFDKINEFYGISFNIKKSKRGFTQVWPKSKFELYKLFEFVKENKCDFLERKWGIVKQAYDYDNSKNAFKAVLADNEF